MTPDSTVKHTLSSPRYGQHLTHARSHITWGVAAIWPAVPSSLGLVSIAWPHTKGLSYDNWIPPAPPPRPLFTVELGMCKSTPLLSPFIMCILTKFAINACYNRKSKESCSQMHCKRFLFLTFRITFTASCFMDLHSFPHDRQSCYLKFGSCKYLPLTKQRYSFHSSTIPTKQVIFSTRTLYNNWKIHFQLSKRPLLPLSKCGPKVFG